VHALSVHASKVAHAVLSIDACIHPSHAGWRVRTDSRGESAQVFDTHRTDELQRELQLLVDFRQQVNPGFVLEETDKTDASAEKQMRIRHLERLLSFLRRVVSCYVYDDASGGKGGDKADVRGALDGGGGVKEGAQGVKQGTQSNDTGRAGNNKGTGIGGLGQKVMPPTLLGLRV
jgi:hypothetical protein